MSDPPSESAPAVSEQTASAPKAVDYDVSCLTCGYNLRGLLGDPVRCPECGTWNTLGQGEVPASLVEARLRVLGRSPLVCVGSVVASLPFFWLLMVVLIWSSSPGARLDGTEFLCTGLPLIALALLWIGGVVQFRQSCGAAPGWGWLLLRHHLYGVGVGGTVLMGMPAIACWLWPPSDEMPWRYPIGVGVLFLASLVLIKRGLPRRYAILMEQIHEMQRPHVVSVLRAEARERLAGPAHTP